MEAGDGSEIGIVGMLIALAVIVLIIASVFLPPFLLC